MGQRIIQGQGLDTGFSAVAAVLATRGFDIAPGGPSGTGAPSIETGGARILWQTIDDPHARAAAFDNGATEVVGPWMDPQEAAARILRIVRGGAGDNMHIACGDLNIRLIDRGVERAGRPITLLTREYELLLHLARQRGQPVSRKDLLKAVWRLDFDPGTNSVEVHVSRLRAKIDHGYAAPLLRTVRGVGYALCPPG